MYNDFKKAFNLWFVFHLHIQKRHDSGWKTSVCRRFKNFDRKILQRMYIENACFVIVNLIFLRTNSWFWQFLKIIWCYQLSVINLLIIGEYQIHHWRVQPPKNWWALKYDIGQAFSIRMIFELWAHMVCIDNMTLVTRLSNKF